MEMLLKHINKVLPLSLLVAADADEDETAEHDSQRHKNAHKQHVRSWMNTEKTTFRRTI